MKIIMKVSMAGKQGVFPAGSVREVTEAKGKHLINVGFAKEVIEPKKEVKKDAKVPNKNATKRRTNKPKRSKKPSEK